MIRGILSINHSIRHRHMVPKEGGEDDVIYDHKDNHKLPSRHL